MPEMSTAGKRPAILSRHARRGKQVQIYLGKQFRFFIYESDWKFLPMAAIIALLVALVIRNKFFVNMEGSLIGAFALTCVGIWNGCFNSIQAVCRERGIIKREHRSGLHITSYMTAHMIYQLFLCLAQTALTMFCLILMKVPIPYEGFITPWMVLDIGITMLLITYASDMLSLFLSSISHTTTGAMTVMPFILIFQLVFSGGIIPLPAWSQVLSDFTISNYGIRALAAQSDYNSMPMVAAWNTLSGMRDSEIGGTFTVQQLLDALDSSALDPYRDTTVLPALTASEVSEFLSGGDESLQQYADGIGELNSDMQVTDPVMLGDLIEFLVNNESLKEQGEREITLKTTIGALFDLFGEENVRQTVEQKTAEAAYDPVYEHTPGNIYRNWLMIGVFIVVFALAATVVLELIDRDKR